MPPRPRNRKPWPVYPIRLPPGLLSALKRLAKREKVTPTSLARRFIALGLSSMTGQATKDIQEAKQTRDA